jgi:hypothetical protein
MKGGRFPGLLLSALAALDTRSTGRLMRLPRFCAFIALDGMKEM